MLFHFKMNPPQESQIKTPLQTAETSNSLLADQNSKFDLYQTEKWNFSRLKTETIGFRLHATQARYVGGKENLSRGYSFIVYLIK